MAHGHDTEVGQVDETSSAHTHALDVLGQWQQLQTAVERLKSTVAAPRDPDPKLAA